MLLTVDIGNTQTTLGLFGKTGKLLRQWRMASDKTDTADELHERLFGYFLMLGLDLADVKHVAIASVVPVLTREWHYMLGHILEQEDVLTVDATRDCGIKIAMPDPRQVGADRIANAVAARASYGAPVVVVDFGTATNIDVVDGNGTFRGGAIMPGLMLSARALFSQAARLSSVSLVVPTHALGVDTETAVQSGIVIGTAAQAEGLVRRIVDELRAEDPELGRVPVVGTGGLVREIARATELFDALDPDLTVRGIYQIWEHRAKKREGWANRKRKAGPVQSGTPKATPPRPS